MLLAFKVSNYRSIRDVETLVLTGTALGGPHEPLKVSVPGTHNGVLPCAIIYGANASGKSNLVAALGTMRTMVLKSHVNALVGKKAKFPRFLLDPKAQQSPTMLEVSMLHGGIRYDYGFEYDQEVICSEWLFSYPEGRRRKIFERVGLDISFGPAMRGSKKLLSSLLKEPALFLSLALQDRNSDLLPVGDFFSRMIFSNEISVEKQLLDDLLSKEELDPRSIDFLTTHGTGICSYRLEPNEMSEEQVKILSDVFKVIATHRKIDLPEPDMDKYKKEFEVQLGHVSILSETIFFPSEFESAGTRRLLLLLNKVFRALDNGTTVVIDEIDASLHTFVVESIVNLFVRDESNPKGAQLVSTTHDTNLLSSEFLRRDEIWFVEKDNFGASHYYSLAEIQSRKGEAFERAYLQGRYGAVPPRTRFSVNGLNVSGNNTGAFKNAKEI